MFAQNARLKTLQTTLKKADAEVQQQRLKEKADELGQYLNKEFTTSHFGQHRSVVLAGIKRDNVTLKRSHDAKDSFTLSIAKFTKFYVPTE